MKTFKQNWGKIVFIVLACLVLDAAEGMLSQLSVPGASLLPTEAPAPTATPSDPESITVALAREARSGVRPVTIAILGTVGVVVLAGGAFILRPRRRRSPASGSAHRRRPGHRGWRRHPPRCW